MLCPPHHVIYHTRPARPYHIAFNAHQAMPCTTLYLPDHVILPYTMLCSQGQTVYIVPWYACLTIPYSIPCPHAMPARPFHIPCHAQNASHACQAISYTMPYIARHSIYHAMPRQTIPYTLLCRLGHTICHEHQAIPYTMPCLPAYIPCHASPCHTIYYAIPTRPYLFPCHACQAILIRQAKPHTKPCP